IHTTGTDAAGTYGIKLADGAWIAALGDKQSFFDVDKYLSAGKVVLTADQGSIITTTGSTVDLSQPPGGVASARGLHGAAGNGPPNLGGRIIATAAGGRGGVFHLDAIALDTSLDALADTLLAGGVTGEINLHTRSGNLTLSNGKTLQANN